jgi:hypothetical protein
MKNTTVKIASVMVLSLSANPAQAANLILNGDFSAELNGWKKVEFTSGAKISTVTEGDNTFIQMHHDIGGGAPGIPFAGDWAAIGQEIASKLTPNTSYLFSYKYKTADVINCLGVRFADPTLVFTTVALNKDYGWCHKPIANNQWITDNFQFTTTNTFPDARTPMFSITYDYFSASGGDIYLDDISIKPAEPATPVPEPVTSSLVSALAGFSVLMLRKKLGRTQT